MTLNMIKLCVGAGSVEDLEAWQTSRLAEQKAGGQKPRLFHTTYQTPKRQAELLDGGSLYWVIKGVIEVRQRLVGFEEGHKEDGSPCCLLLLDRELIPVSPTPRRAFQGWRYLTPEEAPADLGSQKSRNALREMPAQMRRDLAELGLI